MHLLLLLFLLLAAGAAAGRGLDPDVAVATVRLVELSAAVPPAWKALLLQETPFPLAGDVVLTAAMLRVFATLVDSPRLRGRHPCVALTEAVQRTARTAADETARRCASHAAAAVPLDETARYALGAVNRWLGVLGPAILR
jgi:hypothetical protein